MMSSTERHLSTKIRLIEDEILRCKDENAIESFYKELKDLRICLQRMKYKRV